MKLIDEYLDKLYKNVTIKSTIELKQEMRCHLIESANEFKLEGLDEEEACKKQLKDLMMVMKCSMNYVI